MIKALTTLLSIVFSFTLFSQNILLKGKVLDENQQPMPYVNVYIDGETIGTSTNFNGSFEFSIPKASAGKKIAAKFVGYQAYTQSISDFLKGNGIIKLQPQQVKLSEVIITAKGKDPAYYIMKQAIASRKKYLNPTEESSSKLYMKGRAFFTKAPDTSSFLMGLMASPEDLEEMKSEEGKVIYLTESVSKVHKKAPNKIKEELLASRQSGVSPGFSPNRSIFLDNNFYRSSIDGLNERGIISPLSPSAMMYYKFKLLGKFTENGNTINRIQVTPRRKNDPVFVGEIFIAHDVWNIHSLDLTVLKSGMDNPLVDSADFKQSYQLVNDSLWLPLSLQSTYFIKFMGFAMNYQILGRYTEYVFVTPESVNNKKFFNNEVYTVADTVAESDSTLMDRLRPIILDSLEQQYYKRFDSLAAVVISPEYRDSILKKSNKFRVRNIYSGYSYEYVNYNQLRITGLRNSLYATSVDGVVLAPKISFNTYNKDGYTGNTVNLDLRYAFGRKTLDGKASWRHRINRKKFANFSISAGRYTRQINPNNPINQLYNIYYTVFEERNYSQWMSESFVSSAYQQELFNGMRAVFSVKYAKRENLNNLTNYKLFKDIENREFTPNLQAANNGNLFVFGAKFRYRIKQRYATYPKYKVLYPNRKYPELHLTVNYAPSQLSASEFLFTEVGLSHTLDLGLFGSFNYSAYAGDFHNSKNQSLFDFKQFMGNEIPFINNRNNSFQVLPYYQYSTNQGYVELHASQHFDGFLFNKLPLFRKLKWQAYTGVNALLLNQQSNFYEAYIGIENIFTVLSVQLAAPYQNGNFGEPQFLIGINPTF